MIYLYAYYFFQDLRSLSPLYSLFENLQSSWKSLYLHGVKINSENKKSIGMAFLLTRVALAQHWIQNTLYYLIDGDDYVIVVFDWNNNVNDHNNSMLYNFTKSTNISFGGMIR